MPVDAEDPRAPEPADEGGPVKPFLDHLEDLRWVIIKSLVAVGIAMTACMAGSPYLIHVLTWPLERSGTKIGLQFFGPVSGFMASMKIAFWGGLIIALPFVLYYIGGFILPALKKSEKKYFKLAFSIGGGLFIAGVVMCYFMVVPLSIIGMDRFNKWLGLPTILWRAEEYFQFVTALMLGMGLSFEIPILLLTLVKIGILPHDWLIRGRRYFLFINVVVCSFITPDAVSTIFLVVPTQLLMEICIWISRGWERQKRQMEAARLSSAETSPPAD